MSVAVVDLQTFDAQVVKKYSDVIGAKLGGKAISCSDEFFAEASNLLAPKAPIRDKTRYTYQGAWYDGWETRRHNPEPADWVVIKVGVDSARIIGCEVDTAFFNGNQAPHVSVEATFVADGAVPDASTKWTTIIEKTACGPSMRQFFVRKDGLTDEFYNYVRLNMYPDGGIARFRLYGTPIPVLPEALSTVIDLANVTHGGVAIACSDEHFGTIANLLLPGRGIDMSDGWETTRSRTPGYADWVIVRLGTKAVIDKVVVDTAFFRGNFPDRIKVEAIAAADDQTAINSTSWTTIVPEQKAKADFEHEFEISDSPVYTHVKLYSIPDGGIKRLRVFAHRV
ncbi:galactose-binding domain-like protein [Lipomyces oligophaga]|uniref:galactose-binding domain-like protein n=1 Tax=Lipomyces oligophaga TaxID=45792 RepID=UPI0034CE2534